MNALIEIIRQEWRVVDCTGRAVPSWLPRDVAHVLTAGTVKGGPGPREIKWGRNGELTSEEDRADIINWLNNRYPNTAPYALESRTVRETIWERECPTS